MFTASGLIVRFLKVFEKSNYHSIKWVRYLTKASGSYQIRVSSWSVLFGFVGGNLTSAVLRHQTSPLYIYGIYDRIVSSLIVISNEP